jgi:4a-hydroxytetrahydrobiopterin dehydratase
MDRASQIVTPYHASVDLDGWRYQLGSLVTRFETAGLAAGAALARQIAEIADQLGHHPDLDLRPDHVVVRTRSHDVDAVTHRDLQLARHISELAVRAGIRATPQSVATLEVGIDTVDADAIRPFWEAVLGLRSDDTGNLVDPAGQLPAVWFQEMDPPRTDRNRIHFDLTVAHDTAEQRVAEALAAGGRLVSDRRAPAFWVLADAEGNEVCVCTWQNRPGNGEPGDSEPDARGPDDGRG